MEPNDRYGTVDVLEAVILAPIQTSSRVRSQGKQSPRL